MRPFTFAPVVALLLLSSPASAADTAKLGKVAAELAVEEANIRSKEYGGRSNKKMSHDERNEFEAKVRAAREQTFERNGTTARDYDAQVLKLNRREQKQVEESQKAWAAKKEAEAKQPPPQEPGASKIKVVRGFDEKNPVELEEREGVKIQRGPGEHGIEIPVPEEGQAE